MKSCLLWCLLLLAIGATALAGTFVQASVTHAPAIAHADIVAPGLAPYHADGKPTIARSLVNKILCNAHSPACGSGEDLYDFAILNGVNPAFEMAVFKHESAYGTAGIARVTRSLGNIRCAGYHDCMSGYRRYATWLDGYEDFNMLLKREYFPRGLVTVAQIIPIYAPAADHNDEAAYIHAVSGAMDAWRTM